MSTVAEWFKRNFTMPAVLAMISTIIVSGVYIRVQGEAIQQLQSNQVTLQAGMKEISDRLTAIERHGTDTFRAHVAQTERIMDSMSSRIKDVESYNGSINVILTRLGYIESSLNELKNRP